MTFALSQRIEAPPKPPIAPPPTALSAKDALIPDPVTSDQLLRDPDWNDKGGISYDYGALF
jgi:hypothetical protein